MKYILTITAALLTFLSCSNRHTDKGQIQAQVDSLQLHITELETQNSAQEERIKDLEADMEDIITFLNNELNY